MELTKLIADNDNTIKLEKSGSTLIKTISFEKPIVVTEKIDIAPIKQELIMLTQRNLFMAIEITNTDKRIAELQKIVDDFNNASEQEKIIE